MKSVYLAVGHGEKPSGVHDPGAVGGGWTEQTAGDVIVERAAERLSAAGLAVTSEAGADDPAYVGTAQEANRLDVDLLVTIHHDVHTAPEGAFGYHYPGSESGRKLAGSIVNALAPLVGTRNAWKGPGQGTAGTPVTGRNLYVLRATRMPAALIEIGPIGSLTRLQLQTAGDAVAEGVAGYLDITLEDDMDQDTLRRIIREEIDAALGGRDVATDLRRIRISQRAIGTAVGAPVDHQGPDDGTTVIA